jgi:hypothetical protein
VLQYGQKKKTTIWSKGKDNTMVKRKRQDYGQKEKTTLWSKEEDNTMVKRKRQHYVAFFLTIMLSFSFDRSVVFFF